MVYCCDEHIDLALDAIVYEYEVAPNLKKISNETKLSTTCEYCDKAAIYIVTN